MRPVNLTRTGYKLRHHFAIDGGMSTSPAYRISKLYSRRSPVLAREDLTPTAQPPASTAGEVVRQPTLARTLRLIAEGGRDALCAGEIVDQIVAYFE